MKIPIVEITKLIPEKKTVKIVLENKKNTDKTAENRAIISINL